MAHLRTRHLAVLYQKLVQMSPLVGIFGHRQVGKTTFLEASVVRYETFDDEMTLQEAVQNPTGFLSRLRPHASGSIGPIGIDEAQLAPSLFPALKEWVRTHKRPGQFVLSGSVRFSSRKAIRESLTGRIMGLELLPMTLTELDKSPLSESLQSLLTYKDLQLFVDQIHFSKSVFEKRRLLIEQYLDKGGLPGVCFIRDQKFRSSKIQEQLQTILDRDVRLVYPTTLTLREIETYIRALASKEGEPIRFTLLRKQIRLSEATQKKLLQAFEAVFLLRILPIEGTLKGLSPVFEDQAEARHLSQNQIPMKTQLSHLVFRNLREQLNYRPGQNATYFQYRSRGGVTVPFALRTEQGELGIIAIEGTEPTKKDLFGAQSFIRSYGEGKCLLVSFGVKAARAFGPRILQVPAEWLLFE